jgi:mono/diheme cytochrome c family protein
VEILHDLRAPRRVRLNDIRHPRILAVVAAALALTACGGGARGDKTADTAVVRGEAAVDSALVGSGDTTAGRGKAGSDTLAGQGDSSGVVSPAPLPRILRADSIAGFALYLGRGRCASCHGAQGRGVARLGSDMTDSTWLTGDGSVASIQDIIISGVAVPKQEPIAMPSYVKRLTPGDAFRIAAWVYTLSHPGSVVADTSHVPGVVKPATDTTRPPL